MENKEKIKAIDSFLDLAVIPLRRLVVFPNMNLHFDVGRKKSIAAVRAAMLKGEKILLVAQKDSAIDSPDVEDLYDIGVICEIKQMIKIPNSENLRVIVKGERRANIINFFQDTPYIKCVADIIETPEYKVTPKLTAYARALKKEFETYASMFSKISNEVISTIQSMKDIDKLTDYICANTFFEYSDKQRILEIISPDERVKELLVS